MRIVIQGNLPNWCTSRASKMTEFSREGKDKGEVEGDDLILSKSG